MIHYRRHQAFSLIELLLVLSLSSIIITVMLSILSGSWKAQRSQEAVSQTQADARQAIDQITIYGREAVSVVPIVTLQSNTYTSSASVLVLKLASIDSSENVITGNDYVIFRLKPTATTRIERLIFTDPASHRATFATTVSLTQYTSTLAFRYFVGQSTELTPGVGDLATTTNISITATSSQIADSKTVTRSFTDQVYLRNKQ